MDLISTKWLNVYDKLLCHNKMLENNLFVGTKYDVVHHLL